jgi:hypothetical protein
MSKSEGELVGFTILKVRQVGGQRTADFCCGDSQTNRHYSGVTVDTIHDVSSVQQVACWSLRYVVLNISPVKRIISNGSAIGINVL